MMTVTATLLFLTLLSTAFANGVIYMGGMPYYQRTNGAYTRIVDKYNDKPVYQKTDSEGKVWSTYQRKDGKWYLSFEKPGETWDGTIAFTKDPSDVPYGVPWNKDTSACTADGSFFVRGVPYYSKNNGEYVFSGVVHNGRPVYQFKDNDGTIWSLYQRDNKHWYVDFNGVSEDYAGSVAYTKKPTDDPATLGAWTQGTVTRYSVIHIRGAPYYEHTNGAYPLTDEVFAGGPVFLRPSAGHKWSFYPRSDQKWYLDFDKVDETWGGTVDFSLTAGSDPTTLKYNRGAYTAYDKVTVKGMPYFQYTDGEYKLIDKPYNKAPVYTRDAAGHTWSMYQRADGKWYLDFDHIGEDWGGTVSFSLEAGPHPTAVEWNRGIVIGNL